MTAARSLRPGTLATAAALLCALAIAAALRLPALGERPMHHDEANQAVRCGNLLTTGIYEYDPVDHHGPVLYYAALPFVWLEAGRNFPAATEASFRLLSVAAGLMLIAALWLLRDAIGPVGVVAAALLAAVSPAMVYFSRYFIQEMPLVALTLGLIAASWRYWLTRKVGWAIAAGACAGLIHATKETCVITFGAILMAAALLAAPRAFNYSRRSVRHVLFGIGVAMLVSVALYSSCFTNPRGILDSLTTFSIYAQQFLTLDEGHPGHWYYYLRLLVYHDAPGPFAVSEAFIVLLALCGGIGGWMWKTPKAGVHPRFVQFAGLYTMVTLVFYSIGLHKTPWCVLSTLLGLVLLAGAGCAMLMARARPSIVRGVIILAFAAGCFHLGLQAWRTSISWPADDRNPYAYVHTSTDFVKLIKRVHAVAAANGAGTNTVIHVVTDTTDAWPLPWYLRAYSQVGYWTNAANVPTTPSQALIISTTDFSDALTARLGEGYRVELYGLRPGVLLQLRIETNLWQKAMGN